ncbi:MAG: hypothetical protein GY950_15235 [bacterium]|nr:hypothetical protein [bacterium]
MKKSNSDGRTLYEPSRDLLKEPVSKILLVILAILVMLTVFRFINLTISWNMTRLELKSNPLTRTNSFHFLGLSGNDTAQKKLQNMLDLQIREVTVVSYFDLFHPAVFLMHSRSKKPIVNVGIMSVYPEKGFTGVYFHPTEILETRRKETGSQAVYFGNSLFPALYKVLANRLSDNGGGGGIAFIMPPIEDANYLKIPYYAAFFLPLMAILILAAYYGRIFYISFFYYLGLFLLFDFKKALFTVPFSWLIDLLGLNISPAISAIISAALVSIFVLGGFIGIFHNRKQELGASPLTLWGKGLILFFLLLPIFLRF